MICRRGCCPGPRIDETTLNTLCARMYASLQYFFSVEARQASLYSLGGQIVNMQTRLEQNDILLHVHWY